MDERENFVPGHWLLVHGESGSGQVSAIDCLLWFANRFRIVQGVIQMDHQGVAGLEQSLFPKINPILALRGTTTDRDQHQPVLAVTRYFF